MTGNVTVWVYTFTDGTVLQLLQNGLSVAEVRALEPIHGKCSITHKTLKEAIG